MIRGMYSAASGLLAMLARAQVITHNVGNALTPGYKEERLQLQSFRTLFLQRLFAGRDFTRVGPAGMGVLNQRLVTNPAQGSLQETDNPLDLALQGPGFFQVQGPRGVLYTRDGTFRRNVDGLLVNADGLPVLGTAGPIPLPPGEVFISQGGAVEVNGQVVGQLALVTFDDPAGLKRVGANLFEAGTALPTPTGLGQTTIHQGFYESSNVDLAKAQADLMAALRAYEAGQRVLQLADEMNARAASEIGRL